MMNKLIKTGWGILVVFLLHVLVFVGYGWFAISDSCSDFESKNVLVVFGNKVYSDRKISPVLKSRLDKASELFETGCYDFIFVSGGLGKEGIYEGDAMSGYLQNKGILESQIIIDNEGDNSYLTALHTKSIIDELNIRSVTVVTSYYHVARSVLAMKLVGVLEVEGVGSHYLAFQDIIKIPRDIVGFYVYIFKYGFNHLNS